MSDYLKCKDIGNAFIAEDCEFKMPHGVNIRLSSKVKAILKDQNQFNLKDDLKTDELLAYSFEGFQFLQFNPLNNDMYFKTPAMIVNNWSREMIASKDALQCSRHRNDNFRLIPPAVWRLYISANAETVVLECKNILLNDGTWLNKFEEFEGGTFYSAYGADGVVHAAGNACLGTHRSYIVNLLKGHISDLHVNVFINGILQYLAHRNKNDSVGYNSPVHLTSDYIEEYNFYKRYSSTRWKYDVEKTPVSHGRKFTNDLREFLKLDPLYYCWSNDFTIEQIKEMVNNYILDREEF